MEKLFFCANDYKSAKKKKSSSKMVENVLVINIDNFVASDMKVNKAVGSEDNIPGHLAIFHLLFLLQQIRAYPSILNLKFINTVMISIVCLCFGNF